LVVAGNKRKRFYLRRRDPGRTEGRSPTNRLHPEKGEEWPTRSLEKKKKIWLLASRKGESPRKIIRIGKKS